MPWLPDHLHPVWLGQAGFVEVSFSRNWQAWTTADDFGCEKLVGYEQTGGVPCITLEQGYHPVSGREVGNQRVAAFFFGQLRVFVF